MSTNDDQHTPHADGRWAFDKTVTENFDAMLENSIPMYDTMRSLTNSLVAHYASAPNSVIVDIGASRGGAIRDLVPRLPKALFHALEISDPMLEVLHDKFDSESRVNVAKYDLRTISNSGPFAKHSNTVVLSVLTLQFVPIEYRQKIVQAIYDSLTIGGVFLLVEKVLGNTSNIDAAMVEMYYGMKNANGYSYEDIQRKRASLEGVLVPITETWNRDLLKQVGFREVDCYYRHLNFCGLMCIK